MSAGALNAVALLRRLVDKLPQLGKDGEAAAEAFTDYLQHAPDGMTLDHAFGVAPARGEWSWWRIERHARKQNAVRQLVELHGTVDRAFTELNRFAAGRGRFARPADAFQAPDARAASEFLDASGGQVPASARTLRRALDTDS